MALKIIFMGTPEFAVPILKSIYNSNNEIIEVYTQPPKKKNRGLKISVSPIYSIAKEFNLNLRCPETLNNEIELQHLKKIKPNVVVVVAYGKILPDEFLNIKGITFINIHASLLPRWRGAAPIQRAIMNMDKETGISIMKISSKLDTGPVMMKSKISIDKTTTFINLSNIMSKLSSSMIIEAFTLLKDGTAKFIPQNEEEATYANKIKKEEAKINWKEDAKKLNAKINALNPNPGTWFELKKFRVKILKARIIEKNHNCKPGEVLNKNFTIACSRNALQVIELQKEGKKSMSASEFLKGYNLEVGSIL